MREKKADEKGKEMERGIKQRNRERQRLNNNCGWRNNRVSKAGRR
jgi:hypothetical protein